MLVFPRSDFSCNALWFACERRGHNFHVARTVEEAVMYFGTRQHHFVFVDCRFPQLLDGCEVCREIRAAPGGSQSIVVAVILGSDLDNEDTPASTEYLKLGFSRYMVESSNVIALSNELVLLEKKDLASIIQQSLSKNLSTAIDIASDYIYITDENYIIQYANINAVEMLRLSVGTDMRSKCSLEDTDFAEQELEEGRDWSGTLICYKLHGQPVVHQTKVLPVGIPGRPPTHLLFVHKPSLESDESSHHLSRGSGQHLFSSSCLFRKDSPETEISPKQEEAVANRYTSIHSSQIFSHMPPIIVASRPTPVEILKNVPVYTDIYELQSSMPQMKALLSTASKWEFEIFQLEELSENRPLVHMGMHLFRKFRMDAILSCDPATLRNWLIVIESSYHRVNPYHNATHAADVMHSISYFMATDKLAPLLQPLDVMACLVAAAAHDVDHPGKNATFLFNSGHPLSYLYNDSSVLEMHHASITFYLTNCDPQVNIMKALPKDQYSSTRRAIIHMILATEMSKHFEFLQDFSSAVFKAETKAFGLQNLQVSTVTGFHSEENMTIIKEIMLKCADISNPTKPVHLCAKWALRISEEYFAQTDEEKALNLPIVMPLFDRETCPIPKGQIGFMDFIIKDLFEVWGEFIEFPGIMDYIQKNFDFWKFLEELNVTTKEGIESYLT